MSTPAKDEHPWKADFKFGINATNYRQPTLDDEEPVFEEKAHESVKIYRDIHGLKTRNVAALKLYEAQQERKRLREELEDPLS